MLHVLSVPIVLFLRFLQVGPNTLLTCSIEPVAHKYVHYWLSVWMIKIRNRDFALTSQVLSFEFPA